MSVWITSDLHFNHANMVSKYGRDCFASTKDMNNTLIENWNSSIAHDDIVIVDGDFFFGAVKSIPAILNQLNGQIFLVVGNHDYKKRIAAMQECGVEIIYNNLTIFQNGVEFYISHEPVPEDDRDTGKVYLYGHLHDKAPKGFVGNSFHVGVDTNDYAPVNLAELAEEWKKNR